MITVANSKGYRCCTLGDVITLKRGYDLPHNQRLQGEVPVVSSSGITGRHDKAKVKAPGVVTGRYGTLGEVFYVEEDFWPLNTALYVCDFKGNHPKFISYMLRTLGLGFQNAAGAVPGINRNVLHKIPIAIPDIPTQKRIVDILSNYDRLIDNNNRRIALLEESIHKLYKEWFVHLRFPGYESVKVVDGIPEGWERKQIKDFGTVVTGKTPSTKVTEYYGGNIPFIKTPDMHSQVFVVQTENSLTESGANSQSNKTIPAGTLMVSCIGTVGVVAISSTQSQTNQQINSLIFTNDIYRYYCYFALKSLKASLEAIGSNGATMANVNKHKFETMPLLLPKKSILIDFHHYATPAFKTILILQKENILVQQARDLLLPRLMNGSIAV